MRRVSAIDNRVTQLNLIKGLEDRLLIVERHGVAVLPLEVTDPDHDGRKLYGIRADLEAEELARMDARP